MKKMQLIAGLLVAVSTGVTHAGGFVNAHYSVDEHSAALTGWEGSVETAATARELARAAGDSESVSALNEHIRYGQRVLYSLRHYNPYTNEVDPTTQVRFSDGGVVIEPIHSYADTSKGLHPTL